MELSRDEERLAAVFRCMKGLTPDEATDFLNECAYILDEMSYSQDWLDEYGLIPDNLE